MSNEDRDLILGADGNGEQPQQQNTGEQQLALHPRVGTGVLAMAALNARPGLESLNEGLGSMIGNLGYDEYRQFAGTLMQLRNEESEESDHGRDRNMPSLIFEGHSDAPNDRPIMKTRMQKLLDFVEANPSGNIRNMKELLEERRKFNESDIMIQLVLLTRLYYMRGVNMLNPDADPEKSNSLRVREDKDISVRLGQKATPLLYVGKLNGKITVTYQDMCFEWSQMPLEDGKVYVFGRTAGSFTVNNCRRNLEGVFGEKGLVEVPGLMERQVSRAGIAIECHGDDISFFDRASKNTLSFAWEKFSSEGRPVAKKSGISMYYSQPYAGADGSVNLGSSVILSNDDAESQD